jgi:uncharacterized protein CbrC (UPF0167 family)
MSGRGPRRAVWHRVDVAPHPRAESTLDPLQPPATCSCCGRSRAALYAIVALGPPTRRDEDSWQPLCPWCALLTGHQPQVRISHEEEHDGARHHPQAHRS